jgi:hypothetical protein
MIKGTAWVVLRQLKGFGDNAGRYIHNDSTRNELITNAAKSMDVELTDNERSEVAIELSKAWQRVISMRNK